jgi:hypothetical protein
MEVVFDIIFNGQVNGSVMSISRIYAMLDYIILDCVGCVNKFQSPFC